MDTTVKPHISLVLNGPVNAGKSTTAGHFLYKVGGVVGGEKERIEDDDMRNDRSFAHVFDTLKVERERGITIDISSKKFETLNFQFTMIDAPGHDDYVKNMITGTSQADVSLFVVSALKPKFQWSMSYIRQLREQALLAFTLGVKQMICLVNKMDFDSVNYSEERYNHIKNQVSSVFEKVGYKPNSFDIPFIPISGWLGENLTEKSPKFDWYKGPTLMEALDNLIPPKRPIDKPLRLPLQHVYKIGGIGTVVVGRIETGVLKPRMDITFAPGCGSSPFKATGLAVEMHHENVEEARAGDYVGLSLTHMNNDYKYLRRGHVAGDSSCDPPMGCESFEAKIIVLNHPYRIKVGYQPILHVHTTNVACRFAELIEKVDRMNGESLEKSPPYLRNGDCAIVRMVPMKPICVEIYKEFSGLGRFVVRDLKRVVAVGVIQNVTRRGQKKLVKSAVKATRR